MSQARAELSDTPANANDGCVGPDSEAAGRAAACEGCPNQNICATAPKGPDPDLPQITERMSTIQHKILVLSGKGGVGKSTMTSQLAVGVAATGFSVGVLDVDVCGPSMPKMLGVEGASVHQSNSGWSPVYTPGGIGVMSIGFLLTSEDDAVVWRGDKKNGIIKQFLRDVDWGECEFLFIDTPPGTSDEHLSTLQFLKDANVTGAVIVTTPQEVALLDVRKEINFCKKVGLKILGVVENMAGFVCPNCQGESTIFRPSTGGAAAMCEEMGVSLLGSVPLDPNLAKACDSGTDYAEDNYESPAAVALESVVTSLLGELGVELEQSE